MAYPVLLPVLPDEHSQLVPACVLTAFLVCGIETPPGPVASGCRGDHTLSRQLCYLCTVFAVAKSNAIYIYTCVHLENVNLKMNQKKNDSEVVG